MLPMYTMSTPNTAQPMLPEFLGSEGTAAAWWRVPLRSENAYASQQTIATMLNPDAVTITTYDLPQHTTRTATSSGVEYKYLKYVFLTTREAA